MVKLNPATQYENKRADKSSEMVKEIIKLNPPKRAVKNNRGKHNLTDSEEVKEVERSVGVKLDMTRSSDGTMTIIIKGTLEKVKEAKRELILRLGKSEKDQVEVPQQYVGYVIGSGGNQIRQIEASSETRISIEKDSSGLATFSIYGDSQRIKVARAAIESILSQKVDRVSVNVTIPRNLRPLILGRTSERIDAWTETYSVTVKQNREGVLLAGRKNKVDALSAEISQLIQQLSRECQTLNLSVERRRMGQLCSDMDSLRKLFDSVLEKTGVSVSAGEGEMVLTGRVNSLGEALTLLLCRVNSHVFDDLEFPAWMYKHLRKDITVHHSFKGGVITLDGPPEEVDDAKESLEEAVYKISQELVCESVSVSQRHHSRIIGRHGAVVKNICSMYSVEINFPSNKDDLIVLEGSSSAVAAAKKHIFKIVDAIENESQVEISVPDHLHSTIISDEKMVDAVQSLGVSMSSAKPGKIAIKGSSSAVDECGDLVSKMCAHLFKIHNMEVFPLSDDFCSFLKQRRHIEAICERTGVGIEKRKEGLAVMGTAEHVRQAMEDLVEIARLNGSTRTVEMRRDVWGALVHRGEVDQLEKNHGVEIDFDREGFHVRGLNLEDCIEDLGRLLRGVDYERADYSGRVLQSHFFDGAIDKISRDYDVYVCRSDYSVVGRRAKAAAGAIQQLCPRQCEAKSMTVSHSVFRRRPSLMDRIERDYKVLVLSDGPELTIIGDPGDIERAEAGLARIKADLERETTIELPIGRQHVGGVIGHGGSNILRISHTFAVTAEMKDRDESPRLVITGSVLDCEGAKEDVLAGMPSVETIEIDRALHSRLIGSGGTRIANFSKKFKVNVKFSDSSTVEVKGMRQDVENAVKSLSEQVEALKSEVDRRSNIYSMTLKVKESYVGRIIGRKGANIAKIRKKYNVNVNLDSGVEGGPQLTIIGDQESVEKAHSAISQMVASMDSEVSLLLEVPVSVHPILIGKGGHRIREIMTKFGVVVSLPRAGETAVRIVGIPEKVNHCAEYIQSLVDENEDFSSKELRAPCLADYL